MGLNLTLPQKGLVLVTVPVLFQLAVLLMMTVMLRQAEYEARREAVAKEMNVDCDYALSLAEAVAGNLIQYKASHDATYIALSEKSSRQLNATLQKLHSLALNNPRQEEIIKNLEGLGQVMIDQCRQAKSVPFEDKTWWQNVVVSNWKAFEMIRIELIRLMQEESRNASKDQVAKSGWREQTKLIIFAATIICILLAIALAIYFSINIVKRLQVITENSKRLAKELPLLPPLKGGDEIVNVDNVFHEMASELNEARRKERELQQLKQDFVSMVSHDLRTPLTAVHAGLALLATGKVGEMNGDAMSMIVRANRGVDRLVHLVNDLLDIEKLESGKFELSFRQISLKDVAERASQEVKTLADKSNVTIAVPNTDLMIFADEERLVQVLVNLVGNAIKFSPDGGQIEISAQKPPGWVEVRVSDQGPGIPETHREAVFDRFRQLPAGMSKKGSSGLGLAICKAIVEQHGGAIGVESEEGKGSTFWFRLPSGDVIPD